MEPLALPSESTGSAEVAHQHLMNGIKVIKRLPSLESQMEQMDMLIVDSLKMGMGVL